MIKEWLETSALALFLQNYDVILQFFSRRVQSKTPQPKKFEASKLRNIFCLIIEATLWLMSQILKY